MPVERIAEADDPRLADYRDLRDAALRRRAGLFVAESRQIVHRLLGSRFRVRSLLATEAALADLADVVGDELPVYVVSEATIRSVVGFNFHRGCIALGERGEEPALDALLGGRLLVVLDRIANPDNVGGIFRNAMAFGVDGVLLSPECGDPLYRKAIRVSMGGTLRVPFARASDWPLALRRLRAAGHTLVALTPDGPFDLRAVSAPERMALLLGAEGDGLGPAARAAAHLEIGIPMAASDLALNVATACGITLHHLTRGCPK
jgi:tRNA G18 (ribose-2'-O)-methylase SpoU